jgi:hypothetical protein
MNPQEQKIIDDLFDKLAQAELRTGPRDPAAEAHIRSRMQNQPAAPYLMAQTIVMQQQALEAAQTRLTALEEEVARRPASGGFLSGLFGGGTSDRVPGATPGAARPEAGAVPGALRQDAAAGQRPPAQGFGQQGFGQTQPGRGGGFLAGAAQTAMGVAGGMLLGSMISSAFGGSHAGASLAGLTGETAPDDLTSGLADDATGNLSDDASNDLPNDAMDDGSDDLADFGNDEI